MILFLKTIIIIMVANLKFCCVPSNMVHNVIHLRCKVLRTEIDTELSSQRKFLIILILSWRL